MLSKLLLISTIGIALLSLTLGCEQQSTAPATNQSTSTQQTDQPAESTTGTPDDGVSPEDRISAMLRGEKPQAPAGSTAEPELPPGHPPIDGTPSQQKDPHAGMQMPKGMGMTRPSGAPVELVFNAPEGWVEQPPKNSMRKYQYSLPGDSSDQAGEVVVFFFGAGVGGAKEANITRWIGQFTKPDGSALSPEDISRSEMMAGELPVTVVEFGGTYNVGMMGGGVQPGNFENYRMVAGIIEAGSSMWFVKATGPEAIITANREQIVEYLRSARNKNNQASE
jgi:hypothetical protein